MTQLHLLPHSLLLTLSALYICEGELPLAQVSTFEKREVISMV
ncbi:MAG TPA: hypothetical protein V6C84_30955 [Coleofasciculaceae cyanobacterium]